MTEKKTVEEPEGEKRMGATIVIGKIRGWK